MMTDQTSTLPAEVAVSDEQYESWVALADTDEVCDADPDVAVQAEHAHAAGRMLRILKYMKARRAFEMDPIVATIADLKEQEASVAKKWDRRIAWFETQLGYWHAREFAKDPKLTSIELPGGVLRSKKQTPKVLVTDAAKLQSHLDSLTGDELPSWASRKTTTTLAKNELKSAVKDKRVRSTDLGLVDLDGCRIPGVIVTAPTAADRNYWPEF